MFEEALRALMQLEGDGFSATAERNAAARETDIVVSYRPRTRNYIRQSIPDLVLDDLRLNGDYLVEVIGNGAARIRGAAIVDVLRGGRPVKFGRRLTSEQSIGLVSGLLGALDACEGVEEETAEILSRRLVAIMIKHAPSHVCERIAIELMQRVERVPR